MKTARKITRTLYYAVLIADDGSEKTLHAPTTLEKAKAQAGMSLEGGMAAEVRRAVVVVETRSVASPGACVEAHKRNESDLIDYVYTNPRSTHRKQHLRDLEKLPEKAQRGIARLTAIRKARAAKGRSK